jgi:hypothetical protein
MKKLQSLLLGNPLKLAAAQTAKNVTQTTHHSIGDKPV